MTRRLIAIVFIPAWCLLFCPVMVLGAIAMFACWIVTGKEQVGSSPIEAFVFDFVFAPVPVVARWAGWDFP